MSSKLKSAKTIDKIFVSGTKLFAFPIKVLYIKSPKLNSNVPNIEYTVSAPKKLYKRAVDRNRLKRQMRASVDNYFKDINKIPHFQYSIVLVYVAKDMLDYKVIDNAIKRQFKKIFEIH